MGVVLNLPHQPALEQVVDDRLVGVFKEEAANEVQGSVENAVGANRVNERQPVSAAGCHVLSAEGRSLVDESRAVLGGDVIGEQNVVCRLIGVVGEIDQLQRALIVPALHLCADRLFDDPPCLFVLTNGKDLFCQRLGNHDAVVAALRQHIFDLGMHGNSGVGNQCPGRGGPDDQVRAFPRAAGELHAHIDGRFGDVLIPLRNLVVAERCLILWAVRRNAVVLHQAAVVEDLLQRPPFALDVAGLHGPICLVQVDPVAHALGQVFEFAHVLLNRVAALVVELLDAVFLDLVLVIEAELLLYGELNRQTVTVPAGLAVDAEALHGLEARENVFEYAGLNVVGSRVAIGRRRALEKCPRLAVGGCLPAFRECVVFSPEVENLVVHLGEIDLRRDLGIGAGLRRFAHLSLSSDCH